MIGTILYYIGFLSKPIPYLLEITVLIEVLLFSIVLAGKIKDLEKEKLEKTRIILEQSKLATMGEMLQNIAHQWRQPLSEINAVAMKLDSDSHTKKFRVQSLVLCPTRELADQVAKELRRIARFQHNIKILMLTGGDSFGKQLGSLSHQAHIIVGTPGRVLKHLNKESLDLSN